MWTRADIEALYLGHRYAVFSRCKRLLGDEAEARDVTQELFLSLLQAPDRFEGRSNPSTFLYAAATHLCLTRLRAKRLRSEDWANALHHWSLQQRRGSDPHAELASRQRLQRLFETTDEEGQKLLVFHFLDGLSQGEIARLMGLSRVTINQRLQRLRAQLSSAEADEDGHG